MITKETVFILGAGASKPYGYPSGLDLVQIICDNLDKNAINDLQKNNFKTLCSLGFTEQQLSQFRQDLRYSDTLSVDSFLEHRKKEYLELGKLAIAQALIPCEVTDNLFNTSHKSWLKYLFNTLSNVPFDDFFENKISFLTFNYDRTAERT